MGSAMVPLDRALLSSYRMSIVGTPLSVTVWLQFAIEILTGCSNLDIFPFCGGPGPLCNTVLLGNTQMSLPNGISFRPNWQSRIGSYPVVIVQRLCAAYGVI